MIHVTCREPNSGRWLELELSQNERRMGEHLLAYCSDFSCRIEGLDGLDATALLERLETGILAGAATAFQQLGIAPARLQLNKLRGRLTAEDMQVLAHAASTAVLALFGQSNPDASSLGWFFETTVADVRADEPHSDDTPAKPHFAPVGKHVPGSLCIPRLGRFQFKRADTPEEMEQVHRLNYRTFVKEIQQHADTGEGRLVDKFHEWNTYFLAILDDRVIGMLSVHDRAPFSVESRLPDPAIIRQPGMRPLEVRLLAIEHDERHGPVLVGLTYVMNYFARENGYTHYLISAVVEQIPLYKHLGFREIGPARGKPGAMFAPMMAPLEQVDANMQRTMVLWEKRAAREVAAAESKS
jgi:N-acyl amino acid synthase FeeM